MNRNQLFNCDLRILFIQEQLPEPGVADEALQNFCPDNITLLTVYGLEEAQTILDQNCIDAILLELASSESSDFKSIKFLRRHAPHQPLIVLSNTDNEASAFRSVQAGAQDYLIRGCFTEDLFCKVFFNAIERHRSAQRLIQLAHYDELTKLPNRAQFTEHLSMSTARASRRKTSVSLMLIDLDQFKAINDTRGHSIGDSYLQAVAERFQGAVRSSDFLARLGGDEFTVIVEGQTAGITEPLAVAEKILASLETPITLASGETLSASCSIGIATLNGGKDIPNIATLMDRADIAMYYAKQQGGQRFHFYDEAMEKEAEQRVYLKKGLSTALENNEFCLFYHPVFHNDNHTVAGFEALLRWNDPVAGIKVPSQFMPMLEETNLIQSVGAWVLETACRQFQQWRSQHAVSDKCWLSVNLSSRQFLHGEVVDQVSRSIKESGLPPDYLYLEITEGLLMDNSLLIEETLGRLKDLGAHIVVDNFGTGFCSMQHLKSQ
ncbi:MAG: diguanylate cyclase, partial [Pseudomonadales bacterium]